MISNPEKNFYIIKKTIKIKNLDNKFYVEMDYIKDLEKEVKEHLLRKSFLQKIFNKKYNLYKNSILNYMKEEIENVIQESQVIKLIKHINASKKVDFSNVENIIQDKSLLGYSIENNYIKVDLLEEVRYLLVDKDFDKNCSDYDSLIRTQNSLKNKIDDIIGY